MVHLASGELKSQLVCESFVLYMAVLGDPDIQISDLDAFLQFRIQQVLAALILGLGVFRILVCVFQVLCAFFWGGVYCPVPQADFCSSRARVDYCEMSRYCWGTSRCVGSADRYSTYVSVCYRPCRCTRNVVYCGNRLEWTIFLPFCGAHNTVRCLRNTRIDSFLGGKTRGHELFSPASDVYIYTIFLSRGGNVF